jgi:hypothetical protein
MGSMVGIPSAGVDKRLVRRRHVRFWGSPDMADYPPWLVYDANDPIRTSNPIQNDSGLALGLATPVMAG